MGQGPGGVPVAIPMQSAGGVVTVPGMHPQMQPQMVHPQMVSMQPGGVVHMGGQPQMYQVPPAGAMGMHPQIVQVPTSGGFVGQAQVVQGQMVQMPASGTVASLPQDQTGQVPAGAEGVQTQFVRVTPDGPEKGQEAIS